LKSAEPDYVGNIEAEHERILKLGADPLPIETVPGAAHYFEFQDPYGNRLSCYQAAAGERHWDVMEGAAY